MDTQPLPLYPFDDIFSFAPCAVPFTWWFELDSCLMANRIFIELRLPIIDDLLGNRPELWSFVRPMTRTDPS